MREELYSQIIADLIKFMRKLPHPMQLHDKMANFTVDHLLLETQKYIKLIDNLAELDAKGWIK